MKTRVKQWIALTGVMASGAMFAGGCALPENFWVDKSGEIVNSLIISALNMVLAGAGTGIQI